MYRKEVPSVLIQENLPRPIQFAISRESFLFRVFIMARSPRMYWMRSPLFIFSEAKMPLPWILLFSIEIFFMQLKFDVGSANTRWAPRSSREEKIGRASCRER